MARVRPSAGRIAVTVLFAIAGLDALRQVVLEHDPAVLATLQAVVGVLALATAWGSWKGTRWSPASAIAWGIVTAGMLFALPSILDLPPEARGGIRVGSAIVLCIGFGIAWYLRRATAGATSTRA